MEWMASPFWELGLDLIVLDQGLDSLSTCTHDLTVVGLPLLQALLVVHLGKVHVARGLGVYPLNKFPSL